MNKTNLVNIFVLLISISCFHISFQTVLKLNTAEQRELKQDQQHSNVFLSEDANHLEGQEIILNTQSKGIDNSDQKEAKLGHADVTSTTDNSDDQKEVNLNTLELVHVIFRHGNRTPNSVLELYPNDPYINETYYPYGLGSLTDAGRKREYNLGKSIRSRYNSFLGPTYIPATVEAQSTDFTRTKTSLQLVLAGLFPPTGIQIWNTALNWQPISYNTVPRFQDKILLGVMCPNFVKIYKDVMNTPEMDRRLSKYKLVFEYISNCTGLNITGFSNIYSLHFGLAIEEENGFILPEWTKKVWPETIKSISVEEYYTTASSLELMQMAAGYFLEKIIHDTALKIDDNESNKKIYLYSVHESNIAHLLLMLGIFNKPQMPNYGSYVLVEVHKIEEVYGFKIYYQNYEHDHPEYLKIPHCGYFCPFTKFVKFYQQYIPKDNLCGY